MLANLVGNALRFTPPGGSIALSAIAAGPVVRLSVRDTGPGIPERDIPHIFDRFWQARRPGAAAGNGLGLAIARGIVEAHGGEIWVDTAVGRGTTFHFTLVAGDTPVAAETAVLSTPTVSPSPQAR